jgi:hypothetical protein
MNVIDMTQNLPVEAPELKTFDLKATIEDRRGSLTLAELHFLQELAEMAVDEGQMSIVDANLSNPNIFFDSNNDGSRSTSIHNCPPATTVGSARRVQKVETRRASNDSRGLKQAAMKILTINRFASILSGIRNVTVPTSASASRRGSTISKSRAIMEDLSFASSSDDEDSDNEQGENKLQDYEVSSSENTGGSLRDVLTRQTSRNVYGGEGFEIGAESDFQLYGKHYYPWEVTTDPEGNPIDFHIIGADGYDMDCQPLVLSPPQMHSLQEHLPFSKQGESFWLKYSLVRDGADKTSFLKHLRSEQYTVMAMETMDGEVFGAFTAAPWHIQHGYFGTAESFVWRLKHPREDDEDDSEDITYEERDHREREIEVFKYSFGNNVAQICTHDRVAVGGGTVSAPQMVADGTIVEPNQFGFAIAFDGSSLLEATSSPSITFNSPGLSMLHQDGSKFELLNLEVWALTPCITVEEAQRMACQKLFLQRNTRTTLTRGTTV